MSEDVHTLRHRLAGMLRTARVERRMTQGDVAKLTMWSAAKVSRLEGGKHHLDLGDLSLLLLVFDIDPTDRIAWMDMARRARGKSAYAAFSDILNPTQVQFFDALAAVDLVQETSDVVPLLLRTDAYCLAMDQVHHEPEMMDRWQEFNAFVRSTPPESDPRRMQFLLGEAMLWRLVGGTEVMHEQLWYLWVLNRRKTVNIRIVPFNVGFMPGLTECFSLLTHEGEGSCFGVRSMYHDPCIMMRDAKSVAYMKMIFDQMIPASVGLETMLPQAFARLAA